MSNPTPSIRNEGDRVSIDAHTFVRIMDLLTFTAAAASDSDHWRATERASLLLIDINAATQGRTA